MTIVDATGPAGIPCFEVRLAASRYHTIFGGYAADLRRELALGRALCEAAQSRLMAISGARDDLSPDLYVVSRRLGPRPGPSRGGAGVGTTRSFADVRTAAPEDSEEELSAVIALVTAQAGISPLVVDLTRPGIDLPVVRVVGLRLACPAEA